MAYTCSYTYNVSCAHSKYTLLDRLYFLAISYYSKLHMYENMPETIYKEFRHNFANGIIGNVFCCHINGNFIHLQWTVRVATSENTMNTVPNAPVLFAMH